MKDSYRYVDTNNFQNGIRLCKQAKEKHKFLAIIGGPGYGKSVFFEHFKKSNSNVFIVQVTSSMTPRNFYNELLKSFHIYVDEYQTDLYHIINHIADKLNSLREDSLIIIDEAGMFKWQMLNLIRELWDKIKRTSGMILSGPAYFKSHLESWSKKNYTGIRELSSRIRKWCELDPPTYWEVKAICEANGVSDKRVIDRMFNEIDNYRELRFKIEDHLEDTEDKEDQGHGSSKKEEQDDNSKDDD